jgi:hypothetical protein
MILHRFDACYDDIDNPLLPSERTVLGVPDCEPLRSFLLEEPHQRPQRIRWKEMASLLNLPFVPEINFMWFRRRMDSWCVSRLVNLFTSAWPAGEECEELCKTLNKSTASEECFFRLPSYFVYSGKGQPMLYTGRLAQVAAFLKARPRTAFEYWWPADHQWCFCSDADVGATVVGGSRGLISSLLKNPVLECIGAGSTTRVDQGVPMPV